MRDRNALLTALDVHMDQVQRASRDNEFVDVAEAQRLHQLVRDALVRWDDLDDGQRDVLTDAVHYLVKTDDDEDDLRSPIGFDDDAQVVEAALRRITPQ